jgi:iron uptake system component EfeO
MSVRATKFGLHCVSALAISVSGVFSLAARADDKPAPINVTITDNGCEPAKLTAPADGATFLIHNASSQKAEWEILRDYNMMDEKEGIAPGADATLESKLPAGEYSFTCGKIDNPRGTLVVEAAAAGKAAEATPHPELDKPIAIYRAYVKQQVADLVARTRVFTAAVKAGNLDQARRLYAPAHMLYERIEPVAESFNDLDGSMDSREDDFDQKAADPKFLGFHRIEKGLFADHSAAGLAPIADKLMADALDLQKRVDALEITPKIFVGGAAELIEEVASKKVSGEEDRYSRTDLWDFQANVDGAARIFDLISPQVRTHDRALDDRIRGSLAKVDHALAKYRTRDGFADYGKLDEKDRTAMKGVVTALAEDFSSLRGTLGVE